MPPGRGLHRGPGPWSPQLSTPAGDQFFPKAGPTNLDLECKDALQQVLRPSFYPVIVPWMNSVSNEFKRDMVNVARFASGAGVDVDDPVLAYKASRDPVHHNVNGRPKLMKGMHVTGDRAQSDLLRNRSASDQKDSTLHEKRRFFATFSPTPSRDSVSDYFRLQEVSIAEDPTMQVLTEHARRKLHQWQLRGPERDRRTAAQVMRSLRSINEAISRLPRYAEHGVQQPPGEGTRATLFEHSHIIPKGHRRLKEPVELLHKSSSLPAFALQALAAQEKRPGAVSMKNFDLTPFQVNKERGGKSKIPLMGGPRDWSTSAMVVGVHCS